MGAISLDLRGRIIAALEDEPSSGKVGARFSVSASFVRKLRIQVRETGDLRAGTAPGKARIIGARGEVRLRRMVDETPDATLNELRQHYGSETGIDVSETTMWRALKRMGFTFKKNSSTPASASVQT